MQLSAFGEDDESFCNNVGGLSSCFDREEVSSSSVLMTLGVLEDLLLFVGE